MKTRHQSTWFTLCLSTLLTALVYADEDVYFFRIVSTQQTHIIDFDAESGRLSWSNETSAACCIEATSGSTTGAWKTVAVVNETTNGNLTEITIPNLLPCQPSFTTEYKSPYSLRLYAKTNIVFRSLGEWNNFWGANAPPLEADFEQDMVILTSMGEKSTGGYAITINQLKLHLNTFTVFYTETLPRPGDRVTFALTYPVHIVKTPQSNANIKFEGIVADSPIRISPK